MSDENKTEDGKFTLADFKPGKERIDAIKDLLPLREKIDFLPPSGKILDIGPFSYKVTVTNPGALRFSAELVDVRVKSDAPPPKEERRIIIP